MIKYLYYKKWFYQNLPLSVVALAILIYLCFFETDEKFAFLVLPAFIFWVSTIWWGITAFVGMKNGKKKMLEEKQTEDKDTEK